MVMLTIHQMIIQITNINLLIIDNLDLGISVNNHHTLITLLNKLTISIHLILLEICTEFTLITMMLIKQNCVNIKRLHSCLNCFCKI